jgi:hypothetical protein
MMRVVFATWFNYLEPGCCVSDAESTTGFELGGPANSEGKRLVRFGRRASGSLVGGDVPQIDAGNPNNDQGQTQYL